jgi:type II secretory pathway component PulF
MVATGERSGNLARVMQQIAVLCEKELQHTVKTVTTMLEPIMIMVLGGVVGGIVMTILLPVFRLARSVGH